MCFIYVHYYMYCTCTLFLEDIEDNSGYCCRPSNTHRDSWLYFGKINQKHQILAPSLRITINVLSFELHLTWPWPNNSDIRTLDGYWSYADADTGGIRHLFWRAWITWSTGWEIRINCEVSFSNSSQLGWLQGKYNM